MYFPKTGLLIIEVPKCGSRTLVKACKKEYGENFFAGHISIVETKRRIAKATKFRHNLNWTIDRAVRIIREPHERFVSAINYSYASKKLDLDKSINMMLGGMPKTLTSTQVIWVDDKTVPLKTFRIDEMDKALEHLGCKSVDMWENKSEPVFTIQDIKSHDKYDLICEKYKEDFKLWEEYEPTA